jgi:predicted HTH transcriptional regulator
MNIHISNKALETVRMSFSDDQLIEVCNPVKLACKIRELSVEEFADLLVEGAGNVGTGRKPRIVKESKEPKEPKEEPKKKTEAAPRRTTNGTSKPRASRERTEEQISLEKDILQLIRENDRTAIGEVMEQFDIDRPKATKLMSSLLGQQLIALEGAGRGTKYYATKKGSLEGWKGDEDHESDQP